MTAWSPDFISYLHKKHEEYGVTIWTTLQVRTSFEGAKMCGCFALDALVKEIKTKLHVEHIPEFTPSYNIASTQGVLILMQSPLEGFIS